MSGFRRFLNEAVHKISSKDIDMIWSPLKRFGELLTDVSMREDPVDKLVLGKEIDKLKFETYGWNVKEISTGKLVSPNAKKAHKLNPTVIKVGIYPPGYIPDDALYIGFNPEHFLKDEIWGWKSFSKAYIQSIVAHELTHWIDDSLYDRYISKAYARPKWFSKVYKDGGAEAYLLGVEINAVIHQVVILKQSNKEIWDTLTWDDLMDMDTSLEGLNLHLGMAWRKKMKKRMAREGLLGKMMK